MSYLLSEFRTSEEKLAYNKGYVAALEGKSPTCYERMSFNCKSAWMAGWDEGYRDKNKENKK